MQETNKQTCNNDQNKKPSRLGLVANLSALNIETNEKLVSKETVLQRR